MTAAPRWSRGVIACAVGLTAVVAVGLTVTGADAVTSSSSPPSFVGAPSTECPPPRPGPQFYAPSVPGAAKTVALTFDDGPGASTQAIIDVLERFHVRATFMNIGVEEAAHPQLVAEEVRDGFLVGDHTVDHPDLESVPPSEQAHEIDGVIDFDRSHDATSPCVFRPPYGDTDASIDALVNSRRMTVWMWSVDTQDWMAEGSGSAYWVHHIVSLAESEGGALAHPVVLMHNQSIPMPATVAALPTVIEYFEQRGYTFVDLLGRTGAPGSCGSGVAPLSAALTLASGDTLAAGSTLVTRDGEFRLAMQANGDLVVRLGSSVALWRTGTAGHAGAHLTVLADGDVEVVAHGTVVFTTRTQGHPGARLVLEGDGQLAVVRGGTVLWTDGAVASSVPGSSRLSTGWQLASPDGLCHLVEQPDGDLVLRSADGQPLWSTGTSLDPGSSSQFSGSGDLVVRSRSRLLWSSDTTGPAPSRLSVLDTGRLLISGPAGAPRWMTP